MMYFIRPRNYPTWQGIAGHFTITTGKLGEPNLLLCICFVTKPTKAIQSNLYLSTGVSALSTICSTGKKCMDWSLEFSGTLTGPLIRNNDSYSWNSCRQSRGKVIKLISILYRLKLFTLIFISFSTAKISELEPDIILSSGDVLYLTSVVSLEVVFTPFHCRDWTWFCYFVLLTNYKYLVGNYQVCKYI